MRLRQELEKYKVGIVALQEIRCKGEGVMDLGDHTIFYSGYEQNTFGTGFVVHRCYKDRIIGFKAIDERMCIMRIEEKFFNISLICVHAPTNESDEHIKDQFYERLENVYKNTPEHDVKLILGDFNAKLGKEACHRPTIGPYSLHDESNENGLRMIDFAGDNNMTISSTCFKHKDIQKITWASPDGTTKNQIDHVMIDRRQCSDILDVRSVRGADCDTDHFIIRLRYRQRINNAGLTKGKKQLRFDCEKLMKNQNIKRSYQQNLEERLREPLNTENASVEEIWRGIRENIVKTAQETIGYKKRETRNAWMDEECLQALEDRNRARMNMLNRKTRATTNLFQEKRAYARQLCRKKKRDFERSKLEEIMAFAEAKNVRKMYMRIREGKAGFQPRTNFCTDSDGNLVGGEEQVIERWREYFNELLGGIAEEDLQLECNQIGPEPFIEDPQIHEVEEAVESLKNNKAPGEDTITAEMIKAGGPPLLKALHSLIVQIWREEEMPEDWRMAVICPIHKKGSKTDCSNYRGHVERMDDSRSTKKVHRMNPGGRRLRGRPRMRWIDDVKNDLRQMGIRGWRRKAQNRDEWRGILREAKTLNGL
ncbi:craniofacial development protein 2-like [Nilaparvata lugens]|uniref:craniofacial development protein 2-like n=1 Tax=Nilaparvata lugens TaxID=108931 RepID=UPI000B992FBD|nr:craniofacial development protein 2-like [Nilaparvata lugens]